MTATRTSYKTCPLCEATCGLEIVTRDQEVISIRGDAQDVLSHGYLCPKAYGLKGLHEDPDRLRQPMVRHGDEWQAVSWDEAFAEIERGLLPVLQQHGRNALAVYLGNPNIHNLSNQLYLPTLLHTTGTRNLYSASTVDQMPKQISSGLMFGTGLSIAIPDVDHTDYLLIIGANPLVSNGSLMTAPDMRGRLRSLRQRGGKIVVIDPYRTRTAQEADAHHFIRPGTDAHLLFAIVHTLFAEQLIAPGRLSDYLNGLQEAQQLAEPFTPERVAPICGIDAETIRTLTHELATAPHAAVYGRMGTCTQGFGTLTSWLVDVVNILTGNLDREGGVLFPKAAAGARNTSGTGGRGRSFNFGRWKSRVSSLPEFFGELPVRCLAEEIETPGEGQVHALLTVAGNPVLSTPNGQQLENAISKLDFMVSIDIYLNETTRHANVILPPPSALAHAHYDLAFYQLAIHNVAHYSSPVLLAEPDSLEEWEIMLRLAAILSGQGANADIQKLDDLTLMTMIKREIATSGSAFEGCAAKELFAAVSSRRGPERLLDFMLRSGPYGDGFVEGKEGLSLAVLEQHPHGIDLGPLQPRIPEVLRTASGKIELAPELFVSDTARLCSELEQADNCNGQMVLIGRRDLRSNNSWMHNLPALVKGKERCTLHMHPTDAQHLNLDDGERAAISSRIGTIEIAVEVTDAIMPGVVSMPHGWGHALAGVRMQVASEHAGVSMNNLTDEAGYDAASGNAILNGIPVQVAKV